LVSSGILAALLYGDSRSIPFLRMGVAFAINFLSLLGLMCCSGYFKHESIGGKWKCFMLGIVAFLVSASINLHYSVETSCQTLESIPECF
jgi:hypothetical protein